MTQIVSSISGIEIWAPSAGSASKAMYDKNSRDLSKCVDQQGASAIASAYQVVSATATQLYAGTAYLTHVNDAPISASRAGNAANASMATSAYYDGTGRLISSLPDSAAVSSIASSYAESAVSSKADSSALSSYALSADVSSCIDTVSSNSATWGGGATGDYVEKSSYQHCLGTANTLLNTSTASLYLINGSGISANVGGYVQLINGSRNTAQANAFINGYGNFAAGGGSILGTNSHVTGMSLAVGSQNTINGAALTVGNRNTAYGNSMCIGAYNSASAVGYAFGSGLKIKNYALALGAYNSASDGTNVALVIGDGYVYNDGAWHTANHDLMVVTKDGEITMYSSTADTTGTGIMSAIRAISAAATGGGVDSATVSAIASSYAQDVSAAVSGTVDTVSSQSANWGGSALALSAGPGVSLTMVGSTLVAGLDETVLYSATAYAPGDTQQSYSLIETPMNFETVRVLAYRPLANGAPWFGSVDVQIGNLYNYTAGNTLMAMPYAFVGTANNIFYEGQYFINNITSTSWEDGSSTQRKTTETAYTTGYYAHIYKIIGINRTAGV